VFSSGHFISYEATNVSACTAQYRTAVEVEGDLDENWYVFDFIALKRLTKTITDELTSDAAANAKQTHRGRRRPKNIQVRYRDREWRFPREDCVLLPIEHTTKPNYCPIYWEQSNGRTRARHRFHPRVRAWKLRKNVGQSATYEWRAS